MHDADAAGLQQCVQGGCVLHGKQLAIKHFVEGMDSVLPLEWVYNELAKCVCESNRDATFKSHGVHVQLPCFTRWCSIERFLDQFLGKGGKPALRVPLLKAIVQVRLEPTVPAMVRGVLPDGTDARGQPKHKANLVPPQTLPELLARPDTLVILDLIRCVVSRINEGMEALQADEPHTDSLVRESNREVVQEEAARCEGRSA